MKHNVGLLFDDIRNSFEKIGIMIFVVQMVLGARAYGVFVEWYTYRLALMTGMVRNLAGKMQFLVLAGI